MKNQAHLKNTIIEMKDILDGINIRLATYREWISYLEDRLVEITQLEHQKEKENFKKCG